MTTCLPLAVGPSALAASPVRVHGLAGFRRSGAGSPGRRPAEQADGSQRELILRRRAGTGGVARRVEGVAMAAAAWAGTRSLGVDLMTTAARSGRSHLIIGRVEGETIPRRAARRPFAAVRPRLVSELGAVLGRLHSVPL